MIIGLPQDWGKEHKQNLACIRTQKKRAVTPEETKPDIHASIGGSLVEVWIKNGLPQAWGPW